MFDVSPLEDDSVALYQSVRALRRSHLDMGLPESRAAKVRQMSTNTYHLGAPDFHDFAVALTQSSFAADHFGTIAQHCDTDEGIAVSVPVNDGIIVFPRAAGNTFVSIARRLFRESPERLFFLLFALH